MARVFISYSHRDETWKDQIVSQLGVLAGEGLETWDDRRIAGGDDWQPEIECAIDACDVALLLISRHFLTSRFILGNEVPALLQRREQQGVRVIPVILSPCQWTRIGWLNSIQARPKDGKPLSGMRGHKREEALSTLAGELADVLLPSPAGGGAGGRNGGFAEHAPRPLSGPGMQAGARPAGEGARLPSPATSAPSPQPSPGGRGSLAIDLIHLPAGAPHFLGREQELLQLDDAWASNGQTAIVTVIAPGGVGKTALTKRWLDGLRAEHWRRARRVYGWSFYSQGTTDDRQASEDHFLVETLKAFRVDIAANAAAADKGRALGEAIVQGRTLLILDGVEPLQYPPGPLEGRLRAPGLEALLTHLATAGQPGLCLLSSRERLADLAEYERTDQHPHGPVLRLDLGNLSDRDGARLLYQQGVQRAGAAALTAEDEELQQASREVQGHALTLSLLGGYLALAYDGDIRRRQAINFAEADRETKNGHAFKVMHAYEIWLEQNGSTRELAALRLLAYYDRPASPESLAALRAAPAIAGLTEALQDLTDAQWRTTLKRLQTLGLVFLPSPAGGRGAGGEGAFAAATTPLDAHPLIREYLAHRLQQDQPEAWRAGHRRLYEFLKSSVEEHPASLAGLQPLYQAVAHGCKAGLWQEALMEVYWNRILRGEEAYSTKKLGAFGTDLGAVACFFPQPWKQPAPALSEAAQAWLLNQAAFRLRALGRLEEALEPMRVSGEMDEQREEWEGAAISYSSLSELQLTLGRVAAAVDDARTAVAHADRSGDAFLRMGFRTTLADALHQQGEAAALPLFAEAEAQQQERQPQYPLLYSLPGFRYCDALLAGAERVAWGLALVDRVGRVRRVRRNPTNGGEDSDALASDSSAPSSGSPVRDDDAALTRPTALASEADSVDSVGWISAAHPPLAAEQVDALRLSTLRDGEAGGGGGPSIAGKPAPTGDDEGRIVGWVEARNPTSPAAEAALLGFVPQPNLQDVLADCAAVAERASYALRIVMNGSKNLLDIALNHLTLARAALYTALLQAADPSPALAHTEQAVAGLRAAGQQDDLPRGLLTRAWLAHCLGDEAAARADLAEVERIASRGNMRLHLADLHLTRARLFGDLEALAQARRLIEECGYNRRLPELEDAERALR